MYCKGMFIVFKILYANLLYYIVQKLLHLFSSAWANNYAKREFLNDIVTLHHQQDGQLLMSREVYNFDV